MSTPQDDRYHTDRDRGAITSATATQDQDPAKPDRPSIMQMSVSALTAVSATALLSFFGVWGTVLGMGLLSVLTVLGNYMYSTFIHRTADRVKQARPVSLHSTDRAVQTYADTSMNDATRADLESTTPQWNDLNGGRDHTGSAQPADNADRPAGRFRTLWNSMVERYGRRKIIMSIVAVFVVLAGTITVIELAAGKPMNDIVRNDGGSGTSVFGGETSDGSDTNDPEDSGPPSETDEESDQNDPQDNPPENEPRDEQPDGDPPGEQQDGEPSDQQPLEDQPEDDPPADEPPADEPPAGAPAPDDGNTE